MSCLTLPLLALLDVKGKSSEEWLRTTKRPPGIDDIFCLDLDICEAIWVRHCSLPCFEDRGQVHIVECSVQMVNNPSKQHITSIRHWSVVVICLCIPMKQDVESLITEHEA